MTDTDSNTLNEQEVDESNLIEEIELLRSIYVHEIDIQYENGRPNLIRIDLHPATADKTEEQFVKATLHLVLPLEYPVISPEIYIKNSRGLSDEDLKRIYEELHKKADEHKGSEALYQIIETAKEYLTSSNTPSGQCTICLYGFTPNDIVTKTICYHHFHSHCLARYVQATLANKDASSETKSAPEDEETKVVCPVCREEIDYDLEKLTLAPSPEEMERSEDYQLTPELKEKLEKMATLYKYQSSRGGIIDVEAERKKFLIEISDVDEQSAQEEIPETIAENLDDASPIQSTDEHHPPVNKQKRPFGSKTRDNYHQRGRNSQRSERQSHKQNFVKNHAKASNNFSASDKRSEESDQNKDRNDHHSHDSKETSVSTSENDVNESSNSVGADFSPNRSATQNNNGYRGKFRNRARGRGQRPWKRYDGGAPNNYYERNSNGGRWEGDSAVEHQDNFRPKSGQAYNYQKRGRGRTPPRAQQRYPRNERNHYYTNDYANNGKDNSTPLAEHTGTKQKGGNFYGETNTSDSYRKSYSRKEKPDWHSKNPQTVAEPKATTKALEELSIAANKPRTSHRDSASVKEFDSRLSKGPPGFCSEKNRTNCMLVGPPPGFQEKAPFPRLKPPPGFTAS